MYDRTTIGTCGICGGRVSVPSVWMAVIPPTPTCESCGATAIQDHGPVMPMRPYVPPVIGPTIPAPTGPGTVTITNSTVPS